jgi:hypothetical protein
VRKASWATTIHFRLENSGSARETSNIYPRAQVEYRASRARQRLAQEFVECTVFSWQAGFASLTLVRHGFFFFLPQKSPLPAPHPFTCNLALKCIQANFSEPLNRPSIFVSDPGFKAAYDAPCRVHGTCKTTSHSQSLSSSLLCYMTIPVLQYKSGKVPDLWPWPSRCRVLRLLAEFLHNKN